MARSCATARRSSPSTSGPAACSNHQVIYLGAVLTVDAPESRLKTLVMDLMLAWCVELVQARALANVQYRWYLDLEHPPISFVARTPPSLKSLSLRHRPFRDVNKVTWRLSELLQNSGGHIETLTCAFDGYMVRTYLILR